MTVIPTALLRSSGAAAAAGLAVVVGVLGGPLTACDGSAPRVDPRFPVTVAPTDDPAVRLTAVVDPGSCVYVRAAAVATGLELVVRPCSASRTTITLVNTSGRAVVGALVAEASEPLVLGPNTGGFWVSPV